MDLIEKLISPTFPRVGQNWLRIAVPQFGTLSNPWKIPLGFAAGAIALHGATEVLRFVLDKGVQIDVRSLRGLTPFKIAQSSKLQNKECLELLIRHGLGGTPQMKQRWLVTISGCHTTGEALDAFVSVVMKDPSLFDFPLLDHIIQSGNLGLLKALATRGFDFSPFQGFQSPLITAFMHQKLPIVEYLVSELRVKLEDPYVRYTLEVLLLRLHTAVGNAQALCTFSLLKTCQIMFEDDLDTRMQPRMFRA
ncbi:hypothetical protein BU23DRAFT_295950 [Bimuria novae-zelandiae CBS 107.79]|uniref:Uncharacterized protein n=1 Tax=Bimuria novae-zelandiae CBS 107.79 TaxID=1447943 RepID=A0A6A5VJM0_9PLEO|nr:hypothetical protein BU23DRAFT_295950 [Bimuria novae-zelandiae CBS 107.79]